MWARADAFGSSRIDSWKWWIASSNCPRARENKTEVAVGRGASLRIDPDGFLEMADGLVQPALFQQGNPEVVVGQGEIRVAGEGQVQVVDGFV